MSLNMIYGLLFKFDNRSVYTNIEANFKELFLFHEDFTRMYCKFVMCYTESFFGYCILKRY